MKILIQRVCKASVEMNGEIVESIGAGLLVFIGITQSDTRAHGNYLANKLAHLRIFAGKDGKLNHSLLDQRKEVLLVSQFTLYADCNEGRRPSFTRAANADIAKPIYEQFIEELKKLGLIVKTGVFGADMQVSLINDGPLTFNLERG